MATTTNLAVTFDGITDASRLTGQNPVEWGSGFMGYYSAYNSTANDRLVATASLTGSDWTVAAMRFGASFDNKTILKDLDSGTGRRIDLLKLGQNSDVDLISTRARFIYGDDGVKHDVTLGSADTSAVTLYATTNIVTTGSGYVGSIHTGGKDTITIGSGGAGSVRTGSGNDTVKTGSAWVEHISTGSGDDTVKMGSGGGVVWLGSDNDTISISEMGQNGGVSVNGSRGVDTIDFSPFSVGVTFDLNDHGWQDLVPSSSGAKGYVSQLGMENIKGSNKADVLTGDYADNLLKGQGGNDRLRGGDGNDKIEGRNGNDRLFGDDGRDTLVGGKGKDVMEGGKGNDTLRGNAGADVFVFGKNSGTDKVLDFADGTDMLRIADHSGGFGGLSFADQGGNLKITHDGGAILLVGEAGTILTAADFDFI